MKSDSQYLLDRALKFLSFRPRSQKEITDFLHKKTSDIGLINQTIDKLKDLRLINDEEFARWLIESRSRSRPRGLRLIKQELKSKGVTINYEPITMNELDLAQQALRQKQNIKSREQAIRFLQYRGFSWEVIAEVVKKAYNRDQC